MNGHEWMNSYVSAVNGLYSALRKPASFRAVQSLYSILPYALHYMRGKPDYLIFVNRDYKPLGCTTMQHIIYEDYTNLHVLKTDPIIAPLIELAENKNLVVAGSFFIYNTYEESPFNTVQTAKTYLRILESIWLHGAGRSHASALNRACECKMTLRANLALNECVFCQNQKIAYDKYVRSCLGVEG